MRWWLRAHRTGPLIGIIAGLGCLALAAASGLALDGSVTSPVNAGSAVPLILWLPLTVIAALCWACSIDDSLHSRAIAVRPNRLLLTGFVLAAVITSVAALIPAAVLEPGLMACAARNTIGLTGLAMIVRPRVGAAGASAASAGYLATAALLGAEPGGSAAWWAWPVAQRLDPWGVLVATALLLGGLTTTTGVSVRARAATGPNRPHVV